uniref:(northern house mosquito) hypothetical protein n=1 Tax=Culex pipiens TaxID=7175 RepID=A0A8D8F568_CULPI
MPNRAVPSRTTKICWIRSSSLRTVSGRRLKRTRSSWSKMRRATAPGTCASCGSSTKIHTGAPQLLNPCYCLSDESDRDEGNSVRMMKAKKVNWGGATTTNAGGKVTSVNSGLAAESSENSNTSCMSFNTSLIPHSFSVGEIWKIRTNLKSSNLPQRFPAAKGSSRKTLIAVAPGTNAPPALAETRRLRPLATRRPSRPLELNKMVLLITPMVPVQLPEVRSDEDDGDPSPPATGFQRPIR